MGVWLRSRQRSRGPASRAGVFPAIARPTPWAAPAEGLPKELKYVLPSFAPEPQNQRFGAAKVLAGRRESGHCCIRAGAGELLGDAKELV